jgi:tellurite resistance protein
VFRQTGDPPTAGEVKSFYSASILLQLGLEIAEADGHIDQSELKHIAGHIQQHFDLGERMTKRLDALTHLTARHGAAATGITPRTLRSMLTLPQRQLVGEYVVGVAAADRVITPHERKALKKVFRSLDVPLGVLDELLARHEESHPTAERPSSVSAETAVATVPVELDLELIRKMREETAQLQGLLNEVLNPNAAELPEVDDVREAATGASQPPTTNDAIDSVGADSVATSDMRRTPTIEHISSSSVSPHDAPQQYRKFLERLIARSRWTRVDLAALAREQGVMLNAAVEVLNEWTVETVEELLIEESGEEMIVHREYLENG